jgi:hypothetical protein
VKEDLPWKPWRKAGTITVVLAPILDVENSQPIGCIYLQLQQPGAAVGPACPPGSFRLSNHSLQVASTLYQAQIYETLAYQQRCKTLFAGRIQASFAG